MVGLVGYWDQQYNDGGPQHSKIYQKYWRFSLKAFGGTHLIFIDEDGENPSVGDQQITYECFNSLENVLESYSNVSFVFLENIEVIPAYVNSCSLKNFNHPDSPVFYVCGPNYGDGINLKQLYENNYLLNNHVVYIETQTSVPLWSHVAASVALYDRKSKGL